MIKNSPQRDGRCLKSMQVWLLLAVCIVGFLCGCQRGSGVEDEAAISAFGAYVHQLDTPQMARAMALLLREDTSGWKADKTVRQHYADTAHFAEAPLWFSRLGVSADADSLLSYLRREVPRNGLAVEAFFLSQIARDLETVHKLAFDSVGQSINEVLPRLDFLLSKAYVRYVAGQRYGFTRPDRLLNRLDFKAHSKDKEYARLFDYQVKSPDYEEALQQLSTGERMTFLLSSNPKGFVYQELIRCLDSTSTAAERHKIAVNIERCRWQLSHPVEEGRRIVVNIAAQQLWAVSPDSVLAMRICCGAVTNKTPLLNSEIKYMQVNPDWIVPQNIVKSDFLHHAGDSAYFARNHYYIVDRTSGDTLSPRNVTAEELEEGYLRIGQKGGAGNSLGRIVFRFPNDFGVYLHDTNNRGAFKRERRTLSHGCIRVEKPFELACFLLADADEWKLDRLRLSMDIKPESEKGEEYLEEHADDPRPFRLLSYHEVSPRVPLYIVYFTAYPNPATGKVEMWPDLYGYDKVIGRSMLQFVTNVH